MKATIKVTKEVDIKWLSVSAKVRHWEDATVNGEEDTEGTLMPCQELGCWAPLIDVDTGIIKDWPKGTTADIHFKVCDAGTYSLLDDSGETLAIKDGYVPDCMSPGGRGYGDYIIMSIDENGKIENWNPAFDDIIDEDE